MGCQNQGNKATSPKEEQDQNLAKNYTLISLLNHNYSIRFFPLYHSHLIIISPKTENVLKQVTSSEDRSLSLAVDNSLLKVVSHVD